MTNIGNLASAERWGEVKTAVLSGADIEARTDSAHDSSNMGYTALLNAAYFNECEMFSWLIQHGADVHAVDANKKTALHIAAKYGSATVVRQLLLEGVDPDQLDTWGRRPVALTKDRRGVCLEGSKKVSQADLVGVDQVFASWPTIKDVYDRKGAAGLEALESLGGDVGVEATAYLALVNSKPKDCVGKSEAMTAPTSPPEKPSRQFAEKGAPEVFISYCWAEKALVRGMAEQLEKEGFTVWLDVGQMGGGDELFEQIDTGIRGCKVMISCVSPRYAKSLNCRREVSLASDVSKPIVPIIAETSASADWPPKGPMGFLLTGKVYIDLTSNYDDNFSQLVESMQRFL